MYYFFFFFMIQEATWCIKCNSRGTRTKQRIIVNCTNKLECKLITRWGELFVYIDWFSAVHAASRFSARMNVKKVVFSIPPCQEEINKVILV